MFKDAERLAKVSLFEVFAVEGVEVVYRPGPKAIRIPAILREPGEEIDQHGMVFNEGTPYLRVLGESFPEPGPETGEYVQIGDNAYRIKNVITVGYDYLNLELAYASPER